MTLLIYHPYQEGGVTGCECNPVLFVNILQAPEVNVDILVLSCKNLLFNLQKPSNLPTYLNEAILIR